MFSSRAPRLALKLKASDGKIRNKWGMKKEIGGGRDSDSFWIHELGPVAFPADSNHKGEPELANKGHEVAFICEFFQFLLVAPKPLELL